MLDITLVAVGSIKDQSIKKLIEAYQKRIKPYARFQLIELPAVSFSSTSQHLAKEKESKSIINYLDKRATSNRPATVCLMAERGDKYDSLTLAKHLEKINPVILVIGGALGFSDELYNCYPQISLSSLTFPHELTRLVLMEQIYRSITIEAGKDYHY